MRSAIVGAVLALGVTGCAGVQPAYPEFSGIATPDPNDRRWNAQRRDAESYYVCDMETPTGTRIARSVCRPSRLMAERRAEAQELLRRWQMNALIRSSAAPVMTARPVQPAPR